MFYSISTPTTTVYGRTVSDCLSTLGRIIGIDKLAKLSPMPLSHEGELSAMDSGKRTSERLAFEYAPARRRTIAERVDHVNRYLSRKQLDPIQGISRNRGSILSTMRQVVVSYGRLVDTATALIERLDPKAQPEPAKTYRLRTAEGVRLSYARGSEAIERALTA